MNKKVTLPHPRVVHRDLISKRCQDVLNMQTHYSDEEIKNAIGKDACALWDEFSEIIEGHIEDSIVKEELKEAFKEDKKLNESKKGPYTLVTIGNTLYGPDDLENITYEECIRLFKEYQKPDENSYINKFSQPKEIKILKNGECIKHIIRKEDRKWYKKA